MPKSKKKENDIPKWMYEHVRPYLTDGQFVQFYLHWEQAGKPNVQIGYNKTKSKDKGYSWSQFGKDLVNAVSIIYPPARIPGVLGKAQRLYSGTQLLTQNDRGKDLVDHLMQNYAAKDRFGYYNPTNSTIYINDEGRYGSRIKNNPSRIFQVIMEEIPHATQQVQEVEKGGKSLFLDYLFNINKGSTGIGYHLLQDIMVARGDQSKTYHTKGSYEYEAHHGKIMDDQMDAIYGKGNWDPTWRNQDGFTKSWTKVNDLHALEFNKAIKHKMENFTPSEKWYGPVQEYLLKNNPVMADKHFNYDLINSHINMQKSLAAPNYGDFIDQMQDKLHIPLDQSIQQNKLRGIYPKAHDGGGVDHDHKTDTEKVYTSADDIDWDLLYRALEAREHANRSHEDTFIRTRGTKGMREGTAMGSTAYGPVQLTSTLVRELLNDQGALNYDKYGSPSGRSRWYNLDNVNMEYINRFLNQADSFNRWGGADFPEGGLDPVTGEDVSRYNYGGAGDLTSKEDREAYKKLSIEVLKGQFNKLVGDSRSPADPNFPATIRNIAQSWRSKNLEPQYAEDVMNMYYNPDTIPDSYLDIQNKEAESAEEQEKARRALENKKDQLRQIHELNEYRVAPADNTRVYIQPPLQVMPPKVETAIPGVSPTKPYFKAWDFFTPEEQEYAFGGKVESERPQPFMDDTGPGNKHFTGWMRDRKPYSPTDLKLPLNADIEMIFADKYNTELTDLENEKFLVWLDTWVKPDGTKVNKMDFGAYDIKGYWKSNDWKNIGENSHGTDTWKKPNHPTFSDESIYSKQKGGSEYDGGAWMDDGAFIPGYHNMYTNDRLQWEFDHGDGPEYLFGGSYVLPQVEVTANKTSSITPEKFKQGGSVDNNPIFVADGSGYSPTKVKSVKELGTKGVLPTITITPDNKETYSSFNVNVGDKLTIKDIGSMDQNSYHIKRGPLLSIDPITNKTTLPVSETDMTASTVEVPEFSDIESTVDAKFHHRKFKEEDGKYLAYNPIKDKNVNTNKKGLKGDGWYNITKNTWNHSIKDATLNPETGEYEGWWHEGGLKDGHIKNESVLEYLRNNDMSELIKGASKTGSIREAE